MVLTLVVPAGFTWGRWTASEDWLLTSVHSTFPCVVSFEPSLTFEQMTTVAERTENEFRLLLEGGYVGDTQNPPRMSRIYNIDQLISAGTDLYATPPAGQGTLLVQFFLQPFQLTTPS